MSTRNRPTIFKPQMQWCYGNPAHCYTCGKIVKLGAKVTVTKNSRTRHRKIRHQKCYEGLFL